MNAENQLRIVSDGTTGGTEVSVGGRRVDGVSKIEIDPLVIGGVITAKLTVNLVALRVNVRNVGIDCVDPVTSEQIREILLVPPEEVGSELTNKQAD